ncbi:hypothetical protein [Paenibacillus sp.]|uniref:hypothetical protein n=1 Tax=Paenibacillus sp. TaxID=58172 RepID=UPI003562973C
MTLQQKRIILSIQLLIRRLQKDSRQDGPSVQHTLVQLKRGLDLLGLTYDKGKYKRHHLAWDRMQNRIDRAFRLVELKAPKILISNELKYLPMTVAELETVFSGGMPVLTYEQKRDYQEHANLDLTFDKFHDPLANIRNRRYVINERYLGYRLK